MAPIPEIGASPYQEEQRKGPWRFVIRSEIGFARSRMEDAWAICPEVVGAGRAWHAVGVFDGLGGLPHGQEAAWAAADRLAPALRDARGLDVLLPRLNRVVRETGGATTAMVAVFETDRPGHGTLVCVGDSAAYALDGNGGIRMLSEKDSLGPHVLSDFLGNIDLKGHRIPFHIPPGGALLLCTDGVDGVADPAALRGVLQANGSMRAMDALYEQIHERGAPDNATVLVAYRD